MTLFTVHFIFVAVALLRVTTQDKCPANFEKTGSLSLIVVNAGVDNSTGALPFGQKVNALLSLVAGVAGAVVQGQPTVVYNFLKD